MQNFRSLRDLPSHPRASGGWGFRPQTCGLQRLGASLAEPHLHLATGFSAPRSQSHSPPVANFWLRVCLQHGVLLQILLSFTLIFHLWSTMIGGNRGMLSLKNLCCLICCFIQFSILCVYIHNQQKLCL